MIVLALAIAEAKKALAKQLGDNLDPDEVYTFVVKDRQPQIVDEHTPGAIKVTGSELQKLLIN